MRPHDTRGTIRKWERRYTKKFKRYLKAVILRARRELGK